MKQETKPLFVRDISWLEFNERVMQEAMDENNSLHDRLRFLGIFSNNQDEFFRVRVAALNRMKKLGKAAKMHLEENPTKILKKISEKVRIQSRAFDKTYAAIIKGMAADGIFIKNENQLSIEQEAFVNSYFSNQLRTHIVPLMIESIPKFPYLKDKSIYLACVLGNEDNPSLQRYALIEIPSKNISRFVKLPSEEDTVHFILLEDIIRHSLPNIFAPFGFNRFLGYIIKVTRDAEFTLDNDVNTNLIKDLEQGLKNRKKGKATRLVFDKSIDPGLLNFLIKRLQIDSKDSLIAGGGIHNFKDFINFPKDVFPKEATKADRQGFAHPLLRQPCRIMAVIEKQDVLLNFPYHTFDPVIDLLREAAIDPFVESIRITCYRLAKNSKIMNALVNAVRNGKKVTAVLELRARFDEEANIEWKDALEEEGVNVILGIVDKKVHAKVCLIRKREFNKIKNYGFISTGNFNEITSNFYGDHCLLTADKRILTDVRRIFEYLEKPDAEMKKLKACKVLPISPINTRSTWLDLMDKEINNYKKGKPAGITIKLNSLVDESLIYKLYDAAEAGVSVKLIIRGILCLLPHHKKFKTQIHAVSIVDEYLEHARVFIFENAGDPQVYISSADWMVRNLDHRIEASTPIWDKDVKQEIIDIINIQLSGNVKTRILDNKQSNKYAVKTEGEPKIRSQFAIFDYLHAKSEAIINPKPPTRRVKTISKTSPKPVATATAAKKATLTKKVNTTKAVNTRKIVKKVNVVKPTKNNTQN